MSIRQSDDCGRGHTRLSVEPKGASAVAAAVVRKTANQFAKLVFHYHAIAAVSHCSSDQPIVLVITAILSTIKLSLSLRQQRNMPYPIRKSRARLMTRHD